MQALGRLAIYPLGLLAATVIAVSLVVAIDRAVILGTAIQSGEWREWRLPGAADAPTLEPGASVTGCPQFYAEWSAQGQAHPLVADAIKRVPEVSKVSAVVAYCDMVVIEYMVAGADGLPSYHVMRYEWDGSKWNFVGEHCEYNCP